MPISNADQTLHIRRVYRISKIVIYSLSVIAGLLILAAIYTELKIVASDPTYRIAKIVENISYSDLAKAYVFGAERLLEQGKVEEGMARLDLAVDKAPNNARVWLLKGRAYETLGNENQAVDSYRRALTLGLSGQEIEEAKRIVRRYEKKGEEEARIAQEQQRRKEQERQRQAEGQRRQAQEVQRQKAEVESQEEEETQHRQVARQQQTLEQVRQAAKRTLNVVDDVVFYEDFFEVSDGLLPKEWVGGTTLGVKKSQLRPGKRVLSPFQAGRHSFTIPNIVFPKDFRVEFEMINNSNCCEDLIFNIGNLSFGLHTNGDSWLGDGKFRILEYSRSNPQGLKWTGDVILVTLEKNGPVFKLFINQREIKMIRKENFSKPISISFSYAGDFGIYRIVVYKL